MVTQDRRHADRGRLGRALRAGRGHHRFRLRPRWRRCARSSPRRSARSSSTRRATSPSCPSRRASNQAVVDTAPRAARARRRNHRRERGAPRRHHARDARARAAGRARQAGRLAAPGAAHAAGAAAEALHRRASRGGARARRDRDARGLRQQHRRRSAADRERRSRSATCSSPPRPTRSIERLRSARAARGMALGQMARASRQSEAAPRHEMALGVMQREYDSNRVQYDALVKRMQDSSMTLRLEKADRRRRAAGGRGRARSAPALRAAPLAHPAHGSDRRARARHRRRVPGRAGRHHLPRHRRRAALHRSAGAHRHPVDPAAQAPRGRGWPAEPTP